MRKAALQHLNVPAAIRPLFVRENHLECVNYIIDVSVGKNCSAALLMNVSKCVNGIKFYLVCVSMTNSWNHEA